MRVLSIFTIPRNACLSLLCLSFFACQESALESKKTIGAKIAVLDSAYVASKTTYCSVKQNVIEGEGAETLKQIFETSQFVVYGERHNSKVTSELMTALMPIMAKNEYNTLCLEIGPQSAEILKELIHPHDSTASNIQAFDAKYSNTGIESVTIPFISGIEDAMFLAEASKLNMEIWGLDQEYFYSVLPLHDQLLKEAKGHPDYENISRLKQTVDKVILKWFIVESESEVDVDLFKEFEKDENVQSFYNSLVEISPEASEIIKELEISWDIYSRYRDGSHADRISLMRNNFLKNYKKAIEKNGKSPKAFLKFGQVHASQIISKGAYDLGHYINEIADKENVKCTNINSWTRYYIDDEKEIDYLEEYANYYRRLKVFMNLSKRDQWTIINLESIRNDIEQNKIALPSNGDFHEINELIQGYDYQFILPVDQEVTYSTVM